MDDKKRYYEYLLNLLDNPEIDIKDINNELKVNLYLLLLTLNNHYYKESNYINEINIMNDFIRKINNLKVKICLHRKDEEIADLLNDILNIYQNNNKIINRYNKENINIPEVLKLKDKKELTKLNDNLTKIKIKLVNDKKIYHNLLLNNDFNSYYLEENSLIINNSKISLDDFYLIYDYLLDIDNYQNYFLNDFANNLHKSLITKIINLILSKDNLTNEIIISLVLNYLLSYNIISYNDINMSKFKINNIKITDLYSFAKQEIAISNNNAKWRNVIIPNQYIYDKIKQISSKGMYYFNDNLCIIENNLNDFKLTINIDDMKNYLKANLLRI